MIKAATAVVREKRLADLVRHYPPKLSIKALGLLWCHGEERDKAYCLTQLINPPEVSYQ